MKEARPKRVHLYRVQNIAKTNILFFEMGAGSMALFTL